MAEAPGDAGLCRINALPHGILRRVLSHMDALQVVRSGVLSRRWRGLWRSLPRVSFTFDEFRGMPGTAVERDALFRAFVSRFLLLRNPTALDVFNLSCFLNHGKLVDYDAGSEDANLWICHALQCNASSVAIHSLWVPLHLDSSVFASECLLKSLELSNAVLFRGFFNNLQKSCTVLERLSLSDCSINDVEICSETLKVFTIDSGCSLQFPERATISIPSLVRLDYFSHEHIPPSLANMESLETAYVTVRTLPTRVDDICQVLRGLSGVTKLCFSYQGETLKMEKNFQWCPKFNNLTTLNLTDWCLCGDFYALIVFLQNSPNLVKVTLEVTKSRVTNRGFIGDLEKRAFKCEHLEIVEVICPVGLEYDPLLNNLEELLSENGAISRETAIIHL